MKFILLMFTRSHKKTQESQEVALVSNHCQKHLKDTLKVSLINDDEYIGPAFCETLAHLEALRKYIWQMEIGQIWDIPTTKLFPMTINPEICPALLEQSL